MTTRRNRPMAHRGKSNARHSGRTAPAPAARGKPRRRWGLRLLPVFAVVGALALALRLGDVWQRASDSFAGGESQAAAEQQGQQNATGGSAAGQSGPAAQPSETGQRLERTAADGGLQLAQADDGGSGNGGGSGTGGGDALSKQDFQGLEEELRKKLEQRRKELEERAAKLDQRAAMIQAAEQRVDEKIAELEKLRDEIQSLVNQYQAQEKERLQNLVNIYRRMEPAQAARIFEDLDMEVMVKVVQRMRDRDAAPIIAQMNPQKARELTTRLAKTEPLPDGATNGAGGGN